ncbi:putative membrane protein [Yarrowia sp. E02]|nr:putative membrane protein [Yarrowia sp. E02]
MERAASLVGCFLTGIACGTMYLYSAFAPQLGLRLALNTTDTSKIGMIGNLGMALSGPFAGVVVDKHGFQAPIIIGALFMGGGYTIIRLCYINVVASVPTLACAMALVGTGGTFGFASAMKCAAVNFPNARGAATSVPMAAFGLSAFFFSTLFSTYYDGVTLDFLFALTVIPTILLAIGLIAVRPMPPSLHSRGNSGIEMHMRISQPTSPQSPASKEADADLKKNSATSNNVDIYGVKLIMDSQFWKHFLIMGFIAGIGQMFIYSCGFSVKALQFQSKTVGGAHDSEQLQSLQVGAISIASFLGRIGSGYLCDLAATTAPVWEDRSFNDDSRQRSSQLARNTFGGSLRNSATLARRAKKFEIPTTQEDYGLLSRGEDTRLVNNEEEQKKYFGAIQRHYIRFCYDAGDGSVLKAALKAVEKSQAVSWDTDQKGGKRAGDKDRSKKPAIDSIIMSLRKLREAMIAQQPSDFMKVVFLFSVRVTSTMGHYASYVPSVLKLLEIHEELPLTNAEIQEVCGVYALYLAIVAGNVSGGYEILDRNGWKDSRLQAVLRAWETKDSVSWARLYATETDLGRSKMMQSGDSHMAMECLKRVGKSYFFIQTAELEKMIGWKWPAIQKDLGCGWRQEVDGRIIIRERRQKAPQISITCETTS